MYKARLNAEKATETIMKAAECQFLHIEDIAYELINNGYEREDLLSSDNFAFDYRKACEALETVSDHPENCAKGFYRAMRGALSALSKAYLCASICRIREEGGHKIRISSFFDNFMLPVNTKIAYVKNSYSDAAYRVFADTLTGASVTYCGNFAAVCEEVYYSRAGYCILPYETSDEGVLSSFRQLISKYELVSILTFPVQTDNGLGGRITRFALLSKGFHTIEGLSDSSKTVGGRYLKITVDTPTGEAISDIMSAAHCNGLTHFKTESIPIAWDEEHYSCAITFSFGDADPLPFLLYLALEFPESSPESIYTSLLST